MDSRIDLKTESEKQKFNPNLYKKFRCLGLELQEKIFTTEYDIRIDLKNRGHLRTKFDLNFFFNLVFGCH